jgi:hypothetical protein
MEGREFASDELPRFPLAGCSSPVGCGIELGQCEKDRVAERWQSNDSSDEVEDDEQDPLTSLRVLKVMLEEELITQVEYEAKKKEILGRM